jgi:hypothetical protein
VKQDQGEEREACRKREAEVKGDLDRLIRAQGMNALVPLEVKPISIRRSEASQTALRDCPETWDRATLSTK